MTAYYNEIDPFCAQWLRNLIDAGHIAPGHVDERSIEDITSDDLKSFSQCHFFAGLGGWSRALRLAGWADDRRVWTASCPCQPFSSAGTGSGFADERHLWPSLFHLLSECRPDVLFGEQVASADALEWLDLVHADLASAQYALGVSDLCAASVGAPHIRQRLFFVADADECAGRQRSADGRGWYRRSRPLARPGLGGSRMSDLGWMADPHGRDSRAGRKQRGREQRLQPESLGGDSVLLGRLADSGGAGLPFGELEAVRGTWRHAEGGAIEQRRGARWAGARWVACRDAKARAVESTIFPLADGIPNRVGVLRAAGNAIVPEVAAELIQAYMECLP